MITIKSEREISIMRKSGQITRDLLEMLEEQVKVGVTTKQLDKLAYEFIKKRGAVPSFLGYNDFPGTMCTSIDEEVVHGIPSHRVLEEGMLLKIDVGCIYNGYHSDAARTFAVGAVSPEKKKLMDVTKESFFKGVAVLKDGARLGDLGSTIQKYAEDNGFSVVRDLVGHGIGTSLHEDPNVPNFGIAGRGTRLSKNMTIAVEPMVNMGTSRVVVAKDNWTIITADRQPSAHYENTLVITEDGIEILTL